MLHAGLRAWDDRNYVRHGHDLQGIESLLLGRSPSFLTYVVFRVLAPPPSTPSPAPAYLW